MISTHQLRCIGCDDRLEGAAAPADFRCARCGELFEVVYPWSPGHADTHNGHADAHSGHTDTHSGHTDTHNGHQTLPRAAALQSLWRERRTSEQALDRSGVWRFRELLPFIANPANITTLREGNTPVYELPRASDALGVRVMAKHQGMNPTGSFKDTGMTAALSVARERGFPWVACASTGNTSAAMAAYAARGGLRAVVFIPEGKIAWGKLSQAMDYGALTLQLRTDFDGCVRLVTELVRTEPVYLLNSVNPYRLEGQKTVAFELAEQFGWDLPEHIIVPGGNLANSSALGKGFAELMHLGLIARAPKISVVQAAGANPLVRAMEANGGRKLSPVTAETRASAIRIGNPASWRKAVEVMRVTGGSALDVSEAEIALAKAEIGAEGIGCEPASAVTLAGLKKLVSAGHVQPGERAILLLTGHTLKDSEYTLAFHRGDLLNAGEEASASPVERAAMERLRQPPVVLDADRDSILETLSRYLPTPVAV